MLSKTAEEIVRRRYLAKDENGEPLEDIEGLFHRVADSVAEADRNYGKDPSVSAARFYEMMTALDFLPNSPTLMNAGRPLGQLAACFVLPVGDSMEEIFGAVTHAALIHKSGGGTGFSFSRLRPAGSAVRSTGGVASGPVSFMRVFNAATEAVKQGGTRRGANMGILRVDHPDILEFIDCKQDNNDFTSFNISVGVSEEFMRAVLAGEDYALVDPRTNEVAGSLNAAMVFQRIVDAAWRNGEPGLVFLDRLNRDNVVPGLGEIEATNPCGEQPLLPYESCNLGSINLAKMLTETNEIDWNKLAETVNDAVHFLDNVIEINDYPLPEIEDVTLATRKIGLGVMGFADMLLCMGVPYASEQALNIADRVMSFINTTGHQASQRLAEQRGAFPLFPESVYAANGQKPLRNATITTIAPTGTISIIADCSSGVEPVFAYVYIRRILDGTEFIEVNPLLLGYLQTAGLDSDEMMRRIAEAGSIADISEIPPSVRQVFQSAHDISPDYHVRMQAAFQRHTDNAVSKTVNMPHQASPDDVALVFRLAYSEGCKGVTIYRDGSRDSQVLNIGSTDDDSAQDITTRQAFGEISPRPRPVITSGFTERMRTGCGNLYITVNFDENGICEVFTSTGKAGGCPSQSEATARLASVALRSGISVEEVCSQLKGIRCPSTIRQDDMSCTSCPDAIAKVVMKVHQHLKNGGALVASAIPPTPLLKRSEGRSTVSLESPEPIASQTATAQNETYCPECSERLEHEGACVICRNCGYSKCK
ncbi:MAG: vitamin B12-dependent ribonucleotide reductase [Coriobacteriia bacterium]|nr:vitamin B12-dependent ribonucleotide reductase [Coriobacteriia bacterium]